MKENLLSVINGKSVLVNNLCVVCEDDSMNIQMRCTTADSINFFILFRNVSKLNLSDISYPFQICGFEIKDHTSCGYQKDSRYFVNDYENNAISFYCEKIDVLS